MYRLVRNFSIASALAILVVSTVVFLFVQNLLRDEMVNDAEEHTYALTKLLSNANKGRLADFLLAETIIGHVERVNSFDYRRLDRELREAITGLGVLKVKVYATDGRVLYSTEPAQLGQDQSQNPGFQGAMNGDVVSKLVYRDTLNAFEGVVEKVDVVASYSPLIVGDKTIGVFEVYSDVTPALHEVRVLSTKLAAVVGVIFLALFGALLVFVNRADTIIRRQYDKTRNEIQDRIKAEAALLDTESRLRDYISSASEWVWETDAEHRFTFITDRVYESIGVSPSEVIGQSRIDLYSANSPELKAQWEKHKAQLDAREPFSNHAYPIEVNGKDAFISTSGVPVFDGEGKFTGYRGTANNITAEKLAEREVRRSEQKFALAFHANPALVVISGLETGIHHEVNDRWCEILGISREDAIGKTAHEMNLWKSTAAREDFIKELRKKGRVSGAEIQWVTSSGEPRDFLADAEILEFEGENRIMIVAQDITERKRAVDNLQASHDELERRVNERTKDLTTAMETAEMASRTKSEFLANMSHELRTPLNAIIGFSDIIKHEMFGDINNQTYIEYANHIKESGEHLLSLINDILDVSAIEAGKLELRDEEFSVSEAVEGSLRLVVGRARENGITLVDKVFGNKGGLLQPILRADERRVKQILLNLLSNAIKFTPAGGNVSVTTRIIDDGRLTLSVQDTGIGIAKADIPKILSPFGQVESGLSRQHEGAGLGLHLTRNLVELHGGVLSFASKVGFGTRVTVTFPPERVKILTLADGAAELAVNQVKIS